MSRLKRAILRALVEAPQPLTLVELTAAVEARGFAINTPRPARTVAVALYRLDDEGLARGDDGSPQRWAWTRREPCLYIAPLREILHSLEKAQADGEAGPVAGPPPR